MTFYQSCLGGELELREVAGSPLEAQWFGAKEEILHASLMINGVQLLMASDMSDQLGYSKGTDFALALTCSDEEELQQAFEKLSAGGRVLDPVKKQFWGGLFGTLQDKFAIKWMLTTL